MAEPVTIAAGNDLRLAAGEKLLAGMAAVCFVFLAWLLWPHWTGHPDYSHGFFALPAFWLLLHQSWKARSELSLHLPFTAIAFTVPVLLVATIAVFALGCALALPLERTHYLVTFLLASATTLFLFALLLTANASRPAPVPVNWHSLTAVCIWAICTPLPPGTYSRLSLSMQEMVTGWVLKTVHFLNVPAERTGNIIHLATTRVGVEEACSGIRSLFSCVFAAALFAAFLLRKPHHRIILLLLAPILAVAMNYVRSVLLTLLANQGVQIEGFWHDATGFGILGTTAILLFAATLLFENHSESNAPARIAVPSPNGTARQTRRNSPPTWLAAAATVCLLLMATGFATFLSLAPGPSPTADSEAPELRAFFPEPPDGWESYDSEDLYRFAGTLKTRNLHQRSYRNNDTIIIFYAAYWLPGDAPVSLVASHTPEACWPGSGWEIDNTLDQTVRLDAAGRSLPPAEYRFFERAGLQQHVYYWHLYSGQIVPASDPRSVGALLRLGFDYGLRSRGSQLFVRVSANRPWDEIRGEPMIHEFFERLRELGI